ncbi:MAG: hypothetical protein KGL39_37205 [Patescibacteria group bacterium]|nr:hypothetical protein [Patescibacteria group bacterium]
MATINYLSGSERPTAELMNDLFDALDGKLTTLLGGRSFFLAQTATPPQYLVGKAFFFTAGPAVYAPRVPGYIEANTSSNPVATPYNHAQFVAMQAAAVFQPGYLKSAALQNGGTGYLLNDVVTLAGGTVAAGGSSAQVQVTQRDATGKILAVSLVTAGSYTVLPPTPNQVNGGHGSGAWLDCNLFQFDLHNKVAPVVKTGISGASDVGFWEWSLAAHSVWYQGRGDKKPVRYYLQDGDTMPEKHFKFALAEIIIEGVPGVTIEKAWDKYSCFRIHNLNATPATVVFADGNFTVRLTPFQCMTVRRDWTADAGGGHYENYRSGGNYFFKFEGGDPRFYWFFPTSNGAIGYGGKAANSMQANNLVNPALLYDWILFFQRTADGSSTFAGWNEDAGVQCNLYPLLKKYFGDPSDPKTIVGDLIHHKGDLIILRRPKKIHRLASMGVQNGGKNYAPGDILTATGGVAIRASLIQVQTVDADGGIVTATSANGYDGYAYPLFPPPTYNQPTGGSGSGAVLSLQYEVVNNDLLNAHSPTGNNYYGLKDRVTFNGHGSIVSDFAAKQLAVAENSDGNLVITGADPANDVFLFSLSTNLLKTGEVVPAIVDLSGTNSFTIENAIFETEPENPAFANDPTSGSTAGRLTNSAPVIVSNPQEVAISPQKTWWDIYDAVGPLTYIGNYPNGYYSPANPDPANYTLFGGSDGGYYWAHNQKTMTGPDQAALLTLDYNLNPLTGGGTKLVAAALRDGGSGYMAGDVLNPALVNPATPWLAGVANQDAEIQVTAVTGGRITGIKIAFPGSYLNAPYTPNFVTGGSGTGAIIALTWSNTFSGIHKKTVADLLTLDWWGDPTVPGQNSKNVLIDNRAIVLTPQGPVLTFTETDVMDARFAGVFGFYNPFATLGFRIDPNWINGRRGLPRHRQIHFRAHGWGFVGTAHGTGAAIPASGTAGMFLPTQGRQQAIGGYRGEVVAPNGADFFTDGWAFGAPTKIKLLTRIEPLNLQTDGRFWKLHGDSIWAFVHPPTQASFDSPGNEIIFTNLGSLTPVTAMGLTVEMYNGMARAINSITTGTPLMWQCLFFNVGGKIMNLDPQFGFGLGLGNSGSTRADGSRTEYDYSDNATPSVRPVPMNQFAAFDQGSLYQKLCDQLGIIVRTENDLPGGTDEYDKDAALSYFQGLAIAPAVYYDYISSRVTDATAVSTQNPFSLTTTMTSVTSLQTELLSTAALLAGQATGSRCLGTYDPTQYIPPMPGYPDFSTAPAGAYYVASDGSGFVATANGQTNVLSGMAKGMAFLQATRNARGFDWMPGDGPHSLTLPNYRWVQIEDMMKLVTQFGLEFLWCESCLPLELKYFTDPLQQYVSGNATATRSSQKTQSVYSGPYPGDAAVQAALLAETMDNFAFAGSGQPGHGCVMKWVCTTKPEKARWKVIPANTGFDTIATNDPANPEALVIQAMPEVCDIQSYGNASPYFRYLYSFGLGVDFRTIPQVGQRPSLIADLAQILVQYQPKLNLDFAGLMVENYREGEIWHQRSTLGFNIYSSRPIAPISVRLNGVYSWKKQVDWWGSLDGAYAANGYNIGNVPWTFVPPPQSETRYVMDYFDGSSQNGLTIIAAAKTDQRFWCSFSLGYFDLKL